MNQKPQSVAKRIANDKKILIEQLKRTPIVALACEKTGISRATYYRWENSDKKFSVSADAAIKEGTKLINDMAESQLLSAIKNQNLTAIIFWLKHHHSQYETRIELRQASEKTEEKLTPRQEEIIREALKITSIEGSFKLEGGSDEEKENRKS